MLVCLLSLSSDFASSKTCCILSLFLKLMKKTLIILILVNWQIIKEQKIMDNSIYQFTVEDVDGEAFDFSCLEGKKIMIVNTASRCGLTYQYKGLQALYDKYKNQNFIIIGFPANNFLFQEPGTNQQISEFCKKNYGVTFPIMSKIDVKGKNIHPIYRFLTDKSKNGYIDSKVTWNFQKYLINENGLLEMVVSPRTSPESEKIVNWITN
tara:strand:- start:270 stop:896 length:627 start_codon:yes stop_codon:yes gene_type:complete